ncbi:hypothetical protein [Ectobacillus polymachus]|uniref:hypothetical protein n=1 Tax=Ectobacillus polymachus TaxID=1508806 RepID=UPI003A84DC49
MKESSRIRSSHGAIGEYLVLAELLKRDFMAFLAQGDTQVDWDIILFNTNNSVKKVQVKAINITINNSAVNINPESIKNIDYLVIVLLNIPSEEEFDENKASEFFIIPSENINELFGKTDENRKDNKRTITIKIDKSNIKDYRSKWSLIKKK